MTDYIACYFQVKHEHSDFMEDTMKQYITTEDKYIIALEKSKTSHASTDGEHFHFYMQMSKPNYHKFSKKIKEKFNLSGRANKGQGRQYGMVGKIRDQELMMIYTCKDANIKTNMEKKQIEQAISKSYHKEEQKQQQDEIMEYITANLPPKPLVKTFNSNGECNCPTKCKDEYSFLEPDSAVIGELIVKWYRTQMDGDRPKHLNLNRNKLISLMTIYYLHHKQNTTDHQIYNRIMNGFKE